jgi:hypothetical protein
METSHELLQCKKITDIHASFLIIILFAEAFKHDEAAKF